MMNFWQATPKEVFRSQFELEFCEEVEGGLKDGDEMLIFGLKLGVRAASASSTSRFTFHQLGN